MPEPLSLPESRRTFRKGTGCLLSEPATGLDTVYDGASDMKSTAFLYGPRGGRWTANQAYSSAFRSATPRPWQRLPTRAETANPRGLPPGPGAYEPFNDSHGRSGSIAWSSRGRLGPVGYPFDADRRSLAFQSSIGRFHFAATPKRGALLKEDAFVLASDARRDQLQRAIFVDSLQHRFPTAYNTAVFQQTPSFRLTTAPGS